LKRIKMDMFQSVSCDTGKDIVHKLKSKIRVYTKYGNLYKEYRVIDFVNDLNFSLYTMPFVF